MNKLLFSANKNTGSQYKLYNRIASKLLESGVRAQGEGFGNLVKRVSPNLYGQIFGEGRPDWRSVSLVHVFNFLFPNPRCVGCGGKLLGKCNFYCTKKCSMLSRTGYDNPSKNPATQQKKIKTSIARYGTTHPNKDLAIRAKLSAGIKGRTAEQKRLHRERIEATLLERTGFTHNLLVPETLSKRNATWEKKYGGHIWSNPKIRRKIERTLLSRHGVTNPARNPKFLAKASATLLRKTGYPNAMQNPTTFQKCMRSQHRIKEKTFRGRTYMYQGWEDVVFERAVNRYGSREVLTQFDAKFPSCASETGTHPDLFIRSLDTYIEVKSGYTLLGTKKQNILKSNKAKARKQAEAGVDVRWVVVTNHKHKELIILPVDWFNLSRKNLELLVSEGTYENH